MRLITYLAEGRSTLSWLVHPSKEDLWKADDRRMHQDRSLVVVWVDGGRLLDRTYAEQNLRVPGNKKERRVSDAKDHFRAGSPMDPPYVCSTSGATEIQFVNGRHRVLAAIELGQPTVPVFVKKYDAANVKKILS
jgi:hypothetical protein